MTCSGNAIVEIATVYCLLEFAMLYEFRCLLCFGSIAIIGI